MKKRNSPRINGVAIEMLECRYMLAFPIAGPVTNLDTKHQYYLLSQSNWFDAADTADALGGHLAVIDDIAENDFIYSMWGGSRHLWIGLYDTEGLGEFQWVNN